MNRTPLSLYLWASSVRWGMLAAAGSAPGRPELDDVGLAGLELLDLLPLDPARDGELRRGVADVEDLVGPGAGGDEARGDRGEDGQMPTHERCLRFVRRRAVTERPGTAHPTDAIETSSL